MKKILIKLLTFFGAASSCSNQRPGRFVNTIIVLALLLAPGMVLAGKYIASKGKPVENQFIVVFKDDAVSQSNRAAKLDELAAANNGSVLRVYDEVLNGGAVTTE